METDNKIYKIYALSDNISGIDNYRYIGLTRLSILTRLSYHKREKSDTYKTRWFKNVGCENIKITLIQDNLTYGEACNLEIELIEKYRKMGYRLTNTTNGGEGWLNFNLTDEHKLNISKNHADVKGNKNPMFGKHHSIDSIDIIKTKIYNWNKMGGLTQEQRLNMSKQRSGSGNSNSKLTNKDVLNIRHLFENGSSYKELSKMFNVKEPAIFKIIKKITWKDI